MKRQPMSRMVFALVAAVLMTVAHTIRSVKYGRDSQLVRWLLDGDQRAYSDIGLTALISFVVAWVLQPMVTWSEAGPRGKGSPDATVTATRHFRGPHPRCRGGRQLAVRASCRFASREAT